MKKTVCPYCKGSGLLTENNVEGNVYTKCGRCNGTGYVDQLKEVEK